MKIRRLIGFTVLMLLLAVVPVVAMDSEDGNATVVISDEEIRNEKLMEYPWRPIRFKPDLFGVHIWYFEQDFPNDIKVDLQYNAYPISPIFGVALTEGVYIRETPSMKSKILQKRPVNTKLDLLGKVHGEYQSKGQSNVWYEVSFQEKGEKRVGYVYSGFLERREFDYTSKLVVAQAQYDFFNGATTGNVDNYKNKKGKPPKRLGSDNDAFGFSRDQSAPAYLTPDATSDFRYLSDGRLMKILGESGEFFHVELPTHEGQFYVPKKYIQLHESKAAYTQFIVIDRIQQTEVVFEKRGDEWVLITRNLVTTGAVAAFKDKTELGVFSVIEKRSKFLYLDDITKEIDGYAPYALRFNGGSYTHGVPVNFQRIMESVLIKPEVKDALGQVITPAVYEKRVKDLKDPGMIEYSTTIGTIPRSHKCVRHYTSAAKFLYEWAKVGDAMIIVVE